MCVMVVRDRGEGNEPPLDRMPDLPPKHTPPKHKHPHKHTPRKNSARRHAPRSLAASLARLSPSSHARSCRTNESERPSKPPRPLMVAVGSVVGEGGWEGLMRCLRVLATNFSSFDVAAVVAVAVVVAVAGGGGGSVMVGVEAGAALPALLLSSAAAGAAAAASPGCWCCGRGGGFWGFVRDPRWWLDAVGLG